MDKKILVKKTGDILTTSNNELQIKIMNFEFDLEYNIKDKIENKITFTHPGDSKTNREGKYYIGENGNIYHESEVIVGLDEIREYKIENNLEI